MKKYIKPTTKTHLLRTQRMISVSLEVASTTFSGSSNDNEGDTKDRSDIWGSSEGNGGSIW